MATAVALDSTERPVVTIVMPTYRQAAFIRRAIDSARAQSLTQWELVIVDDGSPDETRQIVAPDLADVRLRYLRFSRNQGIGRALNAGIAAAQADLIAYLPSDDVWHRDHLASLIAALRSNPGAVLVYSGVRHHYNKYADGLIDGEPLQLIQALHLRTPDRWLERSDLTTDNLDRMFWDRLRRRGAFTPTGQITAEWVDHPRQRHKLLREPAGGVNPYRVWYGVREPLRMQTTAGNLIDERRRYQAMRERPDTPPAPDGLRILLVGELAYNADRVLALEERGHQLFGLWLPDPQWYNTVGPLPFGHVTDIPLDGWREAVRRIAPDVIYALLNWQAVPFAHRILTENPGIPFVWHFKEGPFICLEKGTWNELIDLYRRADGRISSSPELREWFATVAPETATGAPHLALDGDLPKRDWFGSERGPRLSATDGAVHTVVPGRPIGLHPQTVAELAAHGVHLHFYGDFTQRQWAQWIATTRALAPDHLHLHSNVDQEDWTREFSRYDAGWLHAFASRNGGDIRRADWDDLNYPARMATLAAAGLPMIQRNNHGAIVATQSLVRQLDCGVFFETIPDLFAQLRGRAAMERLRENAWRRRDAFTFDAHADDLVAFFRRVIAEKRPSVCPPRVSLPG